MRFLMLLPLLMLTVSPARAAAPPKPLILAFGDSLTAGYNLERGLGFVPQLQAALRRNGIAATVADGGVSGDTTQGGRARLDWTLSGLPRQPDLVILELGANDMLRGLDPAIAEANLDAILTELKRRKVPVLIAGMTAAPNSDPAYRTRFNAVFPALAKKHGAPLYPFFMNGVAGQPGMQMADGLHPTFAGIKQIVSGILPQVIAALKRD